MPQKGAQAFVRSTLLECLLLEVLWIRAEVSVHVKWHLLFVRGEKLFLTAFDTLQKDGAKLGMTNPCFVKVIIPSLIVWFSVQ